MQECRVIFIRLHIVVFSECLLITNDQNVFVVVDMFFPNKVRNFVKLFSPCVQISLKHRLHYVRTVFTAQGRVYAERFVYRGYCGYRVEMHVLTDLGMIHPIKAGNFKSYGLDKRSTRGRMEKGRVIAYALLHRYRGSVGKRLLIAYETRACALICCVWRVLSSKPKYNDRRPPSFRSETTVRCVYHRNRRRKR